METLATLAATKLQLGVVRSQRKAAGAVKAAPFYAQAAVQLAQEDLEAKFNAAQSSVAGELDAAKAKVDDAVGGAQDRFS